MIPGNDRLAPSIKTVDRIRRAHLRRFVEDHDVELQAGREILRHRQRAHHEARFERLCSPAGLIEKGPDRHVLTLLLSLALDDLCFTDDGRWPAIRTAIDHRRSTVEGQQLIELAEIGDEAVAVSGGEWAEP